MKLFNVIFLTSLAIFIGCKDNSNKSETPQNNSIISKFKTEKKKVKKKQKRVKKKLKKLRKVTNLQKIKLLKSCGFGRDGLDAKGKNSKKKYKRIFKGELTIYDFFILNPDSVVTKSSEHLPSLSTRYRNYDNTIFTIFKGGKKHRLPALSSYKYWSIESNEAGVFGVRGENKTKLVVDHWDYNGNKQNFALKLPIEFKRSEFGLIDINKTCVLFQMYDELKKQDSIYVANFSEKKVFLLKRMRNGIHHGWLGQYFLQKLTSKMGFDYVVSKKDLMRIHSVPNPKGKKFRFSLASKKTIVNVHEKRVVVHKIPKLPKIEFEKKYSEVMDVACSFPVRCVVLAKSGNSFFLDILDLSKKKITRKNLSFSDLSFVRFADNPNYIGVADDKNVRIIKIK